MKKVIFSAALLMAAATVSFAGNPKGETTETKSAPKTEVKADATLITYYVLSQSGSNYNISTSAPPPGTCGSGSQPCRFTSEASLGSSIPKSDVDNEVDDIQITDHRETVPVQ